MVDSLFEKVRGYCLGHPETMEKPSHGAPAFFVVKGSQFATLWDNHHNDGNVALLVAAPPGIQEALVSSNPEVFYRPPYFGPSGWIGVRLDQGLDWDEVEALVEGGYEFVGANRRRGKSL